MRGDQRGSASLNRRPTFTSATTRVSRSGSSDPGLAHSGTELARQTNTQAALFLNSREDASPDSELFALSGTGVAPGSPFDAPDFWTIYGGTVSSPAPAPLGEVLTDLGLPTSSTYNQATAATFKDLNDRWASGVNRVQLSVLLELVSLKTIMKKANLRRGKAIRLLRLRPYLAAID